MPDTPDQLEAQLSQAGPVVVGNGWVAADRWPDLQAAILSGTRPIPTAGRSVLAAALIEHRALTREQAFDLDAIVSAQRLFKDFRLERKLGSGGMGTVFLARHEATGRSVALKTINTRLAEDKDFVERFHREARALERLDHPHVAQIIASGEEDGHCWLAMEYIQGPSLMSLLKKHKALPEVWCLHVMRQIAAGLGYVWSTAGLVHRDLKPENILVVNDDLAAPVVAKLIDFGLVKNNQEDDRLTQTGMTIGTPLYMSPEQVRGEKLDIRSDIYGLGATVYHLLTGQTPFNGSSPGTIMSAHLTEAVPDPGARVPGLRPETRSLVMTAMAKPVGERFLSCEALVAACDLALAACDANADAPKLLRKPMVLKTPVRREAVERTPQGNEVLPEVGSRPPPSERRPIVVADAKLAPTEIMGEPPPPPPPQPPVKPPSARQNKTPVPTARQVRTPTPAVPNRDQTARATRTPLPEPVSPLVPKAPEPPRPITSAAYQPPVHEGGVGILPWVVLGGAVLALIAYLLWL